MRADDAPAFAREDSGPLTSPSSGSDVIGDGAYNVVRRIARDSGPAVAMRSAKNAEELSHDDMSAEIMLSSAMDLLGISPRLYAWKIWESSLGERDFSMVVELYDFSLAGMLKSDEGPFAGLEVEIARGIATLADVGICHCDIKPANIVVSRHGSARLIDWDPGFTVPLVAEDLDFDTRRAVLGACMMKLLVRHVRKRSVRERGRSLLDALESLRMGCAFDRHAVQSALLSEVDAPPPVGEWDHMNFFDCVGFMARHYEFAKCPGPLSLEGVALDASYRAAYRFLLDDASVHEPKDARTPRLFGVDYTSGSASYAAPRAYVDKREASERGVPEGASVVLLLGDHAPSSKGGVFADDASYDEDRERRLGELLGIKKWSRATSVPWSSRRVRSTSAPSGRST